MTTGLRGRIALTAVSASAAALVCVFLLVRPGLRERAIEQTRQILLAEARLMAHIVAEALARDAAGEELDPIVDASARELGLTRVTVIRADGVVLADSSVSGRDLASVQNHADRPEVRAALAAGQGESIRHSSTVEEDFLYVAVPIRTGGRLLGVSRTAASLEGIAAQAGELFRAVGLALALAFLITAALSAALASSLAGPLREITDVAREYAAGNLGARIRARRSDELGELALILNRSADELQRRLTEGARDQARTEAILKSIEDGLLAVDHRGRVLMANEALRAALELGDAAGRHYVEAIRQREVGEIVEDVLHTGERRAVEIEIPRLRRHFALVGIPFPASEGQPHGCLLSFNDVTERRRLERIRRDFVANASHELRTPLTSIRGFVEALEDGALAEPDTARRFLAKIRTHADRMAVLVQDLLDLSRLEWGQESPEWSEVAPAALVGDVAGTFAEIVERKRLALRTRDEGAPPVVTDFERLRRICENLVDNAVKYAHEGGTVELVTRPSPDGGAVVEVRDDGPGIPAEHVPRLFERFYRVDSARSRELGGTGLGLAIVKHLADSIGTRVEVESEVGRGSCFRVTLPPRSPQRPH